MLCRLGSAQNSDLSLAVTIRHTRWRRARMAEAPAGLSMPSSTTLHNCMTVLGLPPPPWGEEEAAETAQENNWIQQAQAHAEALRLWRESLDALSSSSRDLMGDISTHLQTSKLLAPWEKLALAAVTLGTGDEVSFAAWLGCRSELGASELSPGRLLGTSLELMRQHQIGLAATGVQTLLASSPLTKDELAGICAQLVPVLLDASSSLDPAASRRAWLDATRWNVELIALLQQAVLEGDKLNSTAGAESIENARQSLQRIQTISADHLDRPEAQTITRAQAIRLMVPQPSPVPLIRFGGDRDGAYLVPDDLDGIAACFSPGVDNFKSFEDDLVTRQGIPCHLCDFTSNLKDFKTPLIEGLQTFEKKWLEPEPGPDNLSLQQWVEHYCPNPSQDLMLQMDIEGAEYRNILQTPKQVLSRFRIIVIELHGLEAFRSEDKWKPEIAALLKVLSWNHICLHAHPNNCCGDFLDEETGLNIPRVIELTYLRTDRFRCHASPPQAPQLPHPSDIAWNVESKPPLMLNPTWNASR